MKLNDEMILYWTSASTAIKNDILYSTDNYLKWKHSWELSNRDLVKLTRDIQTFYSAFLYNQSLDAHPLIQHILQTTIDEINWEKEETSIGYWLSEKAQGNGLITSSVKFVLEYCFFL